MPFLLPNQQCQRTEGKKYHIPWNCLPQAHLGVFQTLSLTTNSSWLPWGRVVMTLISPLMPVPQRSYRIYCYIIDDSVSTAVWHNTFSWNASNCNNDPRDCRGQYKALLGLWRVIKMTFLRYTPCAKTNHATLLFAIYLVYFWPIFTIFHRYNHK